MSEIEIPVHLVTLHALKESTVSYTSHTQPYTSGTCIIAWHIYREPLEFLLEVYKERDKFPDHYIVNIPILVYL